MSPVLLDKTVSVGSTPSHFCFFLFFDFFYCILLFMDYLFALQNIRESAPEIINWIFLIISEVFLKGSVVFVAIIYWSLNKSAGIKIAMGYSCAYSINQTIKNIACVPRPWILDSRLKVDSLAEGGATGYSFPSGHTVTAASVFGGVAAWQKKRPFIVVLMAIFTLLVAFSRNWLGCHTLKDVIVAILIAGLSVCFTWWLFDFIEKNIQVRPNLDILIGIVGCIISIGILIFLQFKDYPLYVDSAGNSINNSYDLITDCYSACGMTLGVLLGWILERRFVKFEVSGTKKQLILRSVFGTLIFGALYFGLGLAFAFMGDHFCHLVKYFLIMFVVIFVYPAIFWKIEKK